MNSFIIAIGCMLILAAAAYLTVSLIMKKIRNKILTNIGTIAGVLLIIFGNAFTVVPTGSTGVISKFGLIKETPVTYGFNWLVPFVEKVELVNNKQQDTSYADKVWSESSEQTVVYMENISITYSINPQRSAWIVANVNDYRTALLSGDLISSALKTASRSIPTVDVTNRGVIEPQAKNTLQEALDEKYGENTITVVSVVINNIDFEDSYNAALAQRQEAVVNQEHQAILNKTNIEKAEAEAEAKRIQAQANADAIKIEAEAKAAANKKIAESITDETLQQDAIGKWNGELPDYVGDGKGTFGILNAATPDKN